MSKFSTLIISVAVLALTLTGCDDKITKTDCDNRVSGAVQAEKGECKKSPCDPVACAPVACAPVACQQVPCAKIDCKPVDCTPVTCTPDPSLLKAIKTLNEEKGLICQYTEDGTKLDGVSEDSVKNYPEDAPLLICGKKKRKARKSYTSDYSPSDDKIVETTPDKNHKKIWKAINKNKGDIAKNKGDIKTNKEEIKKVAAWLTPEAIAAHKKERARLKALEIEIREYHPKKPHKR